MFATTLPVSHEVTNFPLECRLDILPLKAQHKKKGSSEDEDSNSKSLILCRNCSLPVTSREFRISVQSNHEHTFFNPAGVVYELACFRQAAGVYTKGFSTAEFSWFEGYEWQVVHCKQCNQHLGWLFSRNEDYFYGLIVNRLTQSD